MSDEIITFIGMALLALLVVVGGFYLADSLDKQIVNETGCDRFKLSVQEDCTWCENNGGKYITNGHDVDCIFAPKD